MTVRWLEDSPFAPVVLDGPTNGRLGAILSLRTILHDLWDEHVALTRMVIISFAAGLSDLTVIQARLMKNQEAIGGALSPRIGSSSAVKLTALLKTHIAQAVDVLKAAKTGDSAALAKAQAAWKENAKQVAELLAPLLRMSISSVNALMQEHLRTTTVEATARLKGDWSADIAAYDAVRAHMFNFADVMAVQLGA